MEHDRQRTAGKRRTGVRKEQVAEVGPEEWRPRRRLHRPGRIALAECVQLEIRGLLPPPNIKCRSTGEAVLWQCSYGPRPCQYGRGVGVQALACRDSLKAELHKAPSATE